MIPHSRTGAQDNFADVNLHECIKAFISERPITEGQREFIQGLSKKSGKEPDSLAKDIVGIPLNNCTTIEASSIIKRLNGNDCQEKGLLFPGRGIPLGEDAVLAASSQFKHNYMTLTCPDHPYPQGEHSYAQKLASRF